MKKTMKLVSVLLSATLITSIMAGCSKTVTQKVENSPAATTGTKADDVKFTTIKWYIPGTKSVDHDKVLIEVNKDLKTKINAALDLQVIDNGTYDEKMKLIISSGEDYDVCFTASWMNKFIDNVGKEAFKPLDDLLNKYGQDIKKMQVTTGVLDTAKVNGKLFAIPTTPYFWGQSGLSIQKSLVDKYKLDVSKIKEIEDIEPFLKTIKENEANLIPLKKSMNAVSGRDYESLLGGRAYMKWDDKTLTAVSVMKSPGLLAQDKLDNDWYKKGYIRKDILTVKDDSADQKANKYAVYLNSYGPGYGDNFNAKQGLEYVTFPIGNVHLANDTATSQMVAISANSKNPEAAMKVINTLMSDKEIFNKLDFGLEGTHYKKLSANRIELVKDTKHNYSGFDYAFGSYTNEWLIPGKPDDLEAQVQKIAKAATPSNLAGFTFNPASVQAENAQIAAVLKEFTNGQFVAANLDEYLKARNDKLTAAGYEKFIAELQKQINDWAKANGKK